MVIFLLAHITCQCLYADGLVGLYRTTIRDEYIVVYYTFNYAHP